MARKPLGATPRDRFLRIRTTEAGYQQVRAAAKSNGESISDYIRRLVRQDNEKRTRR